MKKFRLEVIIPERIFFEGEAESLSVETPMGRIGILAGHTPMVIGLVPGAMVFRSDGQERLAISGDGIVEVLPNRAVVLCQTMEWPEELDIKVIKKVTQEWEKRIKETDEKHIKDLGNEILTRLKARLKILQNK